MAGVGRLHPCLVRSTSPPKPTINPFTLPHHHPAWRPTQSHDGHGTKAVTTLMATACLCPFYTPRVIAAGRQVSWQNDEKQLTRWLTSPSAAFFRALTHKNEPTWGFIR